MKVLRAKSAGFCWGVERAINLAREEAKAGRKAYADGPLIHNNQMMDALRGEGIREVGDYQSKSKIEVEEQDSEDSVVVVRAHGISPERRQYLKSLDMNFKDATCPDVGIIAGKVRSHAQKGYEVVIFGDPNHPEVIGLLGYAGERGHVVQSKEDLDALPEFKGEVAMVSQSTMFSHEFKELAGCLAKKYPDLMVFDTVCGATKERQSDLQWMVEEGAEVMVVIGGKHSANTKKLAKLAATKGCPTFHIETVDELDEETLKNFEVVGVTAGASTPDFIIDTVCEKLESL
ncbi:MAG: 4-hydroxy-3-methylbut-2-enyl diphosphate reductase [Opitutae bacterium]|nr:4-hydroxy-3-methylbut-2-enyl diphosphate reductase [Opitutae bacterium]|tara:strand:- start:971 stop:1837 length:867 start_codon:yes stop_codon:yes gene_type:complete